MIKALLVSASLLSMASAATLDGFLSIDSHFFRLQSNAQANVSNGVARGFVGSADSFVFGTQAFVQSVTVNLEAEQQQQQQQEGIFGGILGEIGEFVGDIISDVDSLIDGTFDNVVLKLSVWPFPQVAITKTTTAFGSLSDFGVGTEFQSKSMAVSYPAYFQKITSSNGSEEFLIQPFDAFYPSDWQPFQVTPQIIDGSFVRTFTSCMTTQENTCFSFRVSNSTYTLNGTTFLPYAVKVDITVPVINATAGGTPGVLSTVVFSDDTASFANLHEKVDATVAEANSRIGNANALCSSDIVIDFDNTSDSGYMNWARTASAVSGNGNTQSVSVKAEVHDVASINIAFNASASIQNILANSFVSSNSGVQYIVYTFDVPQNANLSHIVWDPEVGVAQVGTDNRVVGGISKGGVAGIVIACIVTVTVVGLVVTYFVRKNSSKPGSKRAYNILK